MGDSTVSCADGLETGNSTARSRESSSPGRIAISRQTTTPTLRSGPMLQRADCPCCADGLAITNIRKTDNTQRIGHEFDVNVDLQYPASGPQGSYPASGPQGSCTLEWWEKSDKPSVLGVCPDTWTDMYAFYLQSPDLQSPDVQVPSFDLWKNRDETCASSSRVTMSDDPHMGKRPGRTETRTLEFKIKVNSMPATSDSGCEHASQEVTAKQVLVMVNGAADRRKPSSFTTP